ncbi:MAG: hypothetical protein AB7K24_04830 [Gemmataceae bacterium]
MEVVSLPTLDELRAYVHKTLCSHDRLDPEQTPLFEGLILRKGRNCGLFFQAHGPRLLKTYALWSADEDRILFYDATGARFGEARLSEAPDPGKLAA